LKGIISGFLCFLLLSTAVFAEKVNVVGSRLGLSLRDTSGNFALYCFDESGKQISLFDTQQNSASSAFYLRIDDKIYKLRKELGTTVRAYSTPAGGALHYIIKKKAEIFVEFTIVETIADKSADAFRVDIKVNNIANDPSTFALKGVFDTVWGERGQTVFATAANGSFSNEFQITKPEEHQWVKLDEANRSLQFLFFGPGITSPEAVSIANKDILSTAAWDAGSTSGRSFTSISSVNNPAVELRWQPMTLAKNLTASYTFYITVSNSGKSPGLIELDPSLESPDYNDATPPPVVRPAPVAPTPAPVAPTPVAPPSRPGTIPAPRVIRTPNTAQNQPSTQPRPGASTSPPAVSQSSDVDYALSLIEQINRLPNTAINQAELRRLNAELDRVSARLGL
jgi:hypothetical protein